LRGSFSIVRTERRRLEDERREFERALLAGQAADLLVALRSSLKLSQRELARRLGISESRISQVLAGGENLTLKSISDLGWAMGVRFELVPAPVGDRSPTPAASDPPPPRWLRRFAEEALKRIREAWEAT
jgi:transcriptional regulator with XRE-family HTH domain